MGKIIDSISIENFRGIQNLNLTFDSLNIFIGNNGTNKTSILEAINYAFSPSFLSGRIKPTDFYEGIDTQIKIDVTFTKPFKVKLPDGYTYQEIECDKIALTIKKRDRKSPGKVLSDLVVVDHIVLPNFNPQNNEEWNIKRKSGTEFKFGKRLLSFNVFESDEIPRSFYFNKEREKQLYKGFNTSFSSIIDDFNWRFLKSSINDNEVFNKIDETESKIINLVNVDVHEVIKEFNKRIKKFGLENVSLSFIDKGSPFDQAFLSKKFNNINLPTKYLGSGIEMIYSILFLESLASLSKEKLIILIDEPELHLHPSLQQIFANYLHELSEQENYQIFITTHSPVFFKTLVNKDEVKAIITKRGDNNNFNASDYVQKPSIFPWGPTWGEINYFAYDYSTVEFHNELYGYLQELSKKTDNYDFDCFLNKEHNIKKDKEWTPERKGIPQQTKNVTLMTFIRHKIHHPENETMKNINYTVEELKLSIQIMINLINKIEKEKSKT
jgi:predicted ATP-dependent endonuclease of OLD family